MLFTYLFHKDVFNNSILYLDEGWSSEANSYFEEIAQGQILQANVTAILEDGSYSVQLYKVQGVSVSTKKTLIQQYMDFINEFCAPEHSHQQRTGQAGIRRMDQSNQQQALRRATLS